MNAATSHAVDADIRQILRDEAVLIRAGVLARADSEDYRAHPNRWRHEIGTCRKLEDAMQRANVDPVVGWTMSVRELVAASVKVFESARGVDR